MSATRSPAGSSSTGVREDKPICTMAVSVRNQKGEECLSGVATTFTVALRRKS